MSDAIKHECGIALIRLLKPLDYYANKYGDFLYGIKQLYILMEKQHNRGQDGAGIGVISLGVEPGNPYFYRDRSVSNTPIAEIYTRINQKYSAFRNKYPINDLTVMKKYLPFMGELLLGHLRYGTHGNNSIENCHPIYRQNNWKTRNLMIAGNFNMTNNEALFNILVELGQYPLEHSDTITVLEKFGHFLDSENEFLYRKFKEEGFSKREITKKIVESLNLEYILKKSARDFDGGYVIAGLIGHGDAFVLRDPSGIRPAYYYANDEFVVAASEKPAIRTAFDLPYQEIEEVKPGHALIIKKSGVILEPEIVPPLKKMSCSFERIYFSRGTDENIYQERKRLGYYLTGRVLKSIDHDLDNSVFSYIPNTAEIAFLGLLNGIEDHLNAIKKNRIISEKPDPERLLKILSERIRVEKIAVKDTKIRTFITEDVHRKDLVAHVYDTTYGLIRNHQDNLIVLDDSIVRGTTLKESIIAILDHLLPKKIVIVSSAPQIRYPDCYGIDMSKLKDFIAFRAAIGLLKEKNKDYVISEVYNLCKDQVKLEEKYNVNNVKAIYEPFTEQEITNKIIELVTPPDMHAELDIIYQSIEDLHRAIPEHKGDWYFTGNYPTTGGNKVVNQAFINFYEGKDIRAY
jgi:amidophosphoribosyltransferase